MKVKVVATPDEATAILKLVAVSATKALANLRQATSEANALNVLWQMKVTPSGCDPLDADSPLNLIEQLNQTFTYIASAKAVKILLKQHPTEAPFRLNLGTTGGSDIESQNGRLAAEVFAAVNTSNNRKLSKDMKKVSACPAPLKYVFFMCPGYAEGRQRQLEKAFGGEVWSVGADV